ncbi:DNA-directed RNA polymerases I and III subunit RPAC1-like [Salvia splendens]|uniref:DNA-directed RNA polymerases I and III subunit RPAC1-like n=1 Tax=Salvia splendens TaxID=180675 RepID=UPI001C25226D|nr:DNA-directed RNA polymerases I and III subunit RPAC1-like [Salvia splendens]
MGVDNSLRLPEFRTNFKVEVISLSEDDMEFDMIGIDASIANAFRRILIAEVFIANNTSVIQDEVLSHRLGLVPLKVDPRHFNYMSEKDEPNEKNTIVFKLHARCEKGGHVLKSGFHARICKQPNCHQAWGIILAKLGPKQEIELEAHAVKGMGKTHAKWSPVATAWYRMLPELQLNPREHCPLKYCSLKL